MNNLIIELPFSGFYHSMHDFYIDNFIEYEIEYLKNELNYTDEQIDIIKDRFYMMDYAPIREAICKHYIQAYNDVFYDEHNIHLDLTFHSMTSPKFYNFETDRLYAEITQDTFNQIIALLSDDATQAKLRDKYKSRDGYFVFESTIEAIEQKDYERFSADLLEMLLPENTVIEDYQYTDNVSEVVMNAINWNALDSLNDQ